MTHQITPFSAKLLLALDSNQKLIELAMLVSTFPVLADSSSTQGITYFLKSTRWGVIQRILFKNQKRKFGSFNARCCIPQHKNDSYQAALELIPLSAYSQAELDRVGGFLLIEESLFELEIDDSSEADKSQSVGSACNTHTKVWKAILNDTLTALDFGG